MNPKPQSTRETILRAAVAVIHGAASVREVTIRSIIDGAGVNLNAVNYHFGSKESLLREALRSIIGDYYRSRGIAPGSSGPGLYENVVRICDFLFDEPVASRLALDSELGQGGSGPSLTAETLASLAELLRLALPGTPEPELRFRAWAITAVVHQFLLRPSGCAEWLSSDPRDKAERDALLARLCALVGAAKE